MQTPLPSTKGSVNAIARKWCSQAGTLSPVMFYVISSLQVFRCLQPFMVTLSVSATAQAVKQISDRHDADVIRWVNDILMNTEVKYMW